MILLCHIPCHSIRQFANTCSFCMFWWGQCLLTLVLRILRRCMVQACDLCLHISNPRTCCNAILRILIVYQIPTYYLGQTWVITSCTIRYVFGSKSTNFPLVKTVGSTAFNLTHFLLLPLFGPSPSQSVIRVSTHKSELSCIGLSVKRGGGTPRPLNRP